MRRSKDHGLLDDVVIEIPIPSNAAQPHFQSFSVLVPLTSPLHMEIWWRLHPTSFTQFVTSLFAIRDIVVILGLV